MFAPPTPRAKPQSRLSSEELARLHAKMAFYEQPITTFNRPVENDPSELVRSTRAVRSRSVLSPIAERKKSKTPSIERADPVPLCFLVRFAQRTFKALRVLLSPRKRHEKTTVATAIALAGAMNEEFATAARRRHQELDDSTRFRLELAGIRIQSAPFTYSVSV